MNEDLANIKQEEKNQACDKPYSARRGRWILKGINYSRGYAKFVNIVTGDKRYVALLNHPGSRDRFSRVLFEKAESAVALRKKVLERLERLKAAE